MVDDIFWNLLMGFKNRIYAACSSGAGGVGSNPANSDAQKLPSFRRWRFKMKLSLFNYLHYVYYIHYAYYSNSVYVRIELCLADHVWKDRRAAIAQEIYGSAYQICPAMCALACKLQNEYPEWGAADLALQRLDHPLDRVLWSWTIIDDVLLLRRRISAVNTGLQFGFLYIMSINAK
jgi:hypothetical protein